jgi:hypothetical protein
VRGYDRGQMRRHFRTDIDDAWALGYAVKRSWQ